jgi:hypothetical protein
MAAASSSGTGEDIIADEFSEIRKRLRHMILIEKMSFFG